MNTGDERDLDLNLLRVLVVVADEGSVTRAAARLYLTQPAVSAALRRLHDAVGAPLFTREGRGVALTARGRRTVEAARPHLRGLLDALRAAPSFSPSTCDRTFRLGLSDDLEFTLLPALLGRLRREAPGARLLVLPVQFRTVNDALASRAVDLAVTVADETPAQVERAVLGRGRFVCVDDPRAAGRRGPLTRGDYVDGAHVIVSYNGDLRGIIEDATSVRRRVVCSVARFSNLGALVAGTDLIATVPSPVARHMAARHRSLRVSPLPLRLPTTPVEALWNKSDDDPALTWLRELLREVYARAVAS